MAPITAADGTTGGGAVAMTPEVLKVNEAARESGGTAQSFLVTIPSGVYPGMQFTVNVNGQRFMVTCPNNAGPDMKVRIVPPAQREEPVAAPKTQVFEVKVPQGVKPKQPFTLMANGQRVLVTCPPNVVPGQKIRFQLPVQHVIGSIQLSYDSQTGGWCRTIRVTDLKFQWVRVNKTKEEEEVSGSNVDVDGMEKFDFTKSAYVRKISFLEGNDARMRTGIVELVSANEAVVDSRLVHQGKTLVSYADIANIQGKALEEKTQWFQNICGQLTAMWDSGHIKIVVRRHHLLNDSLEAVMSLGRDDLRKRWRIEFLGEPAIDAGGVTREWFQLVSEKIFDPDFGLWLSSVNNQMCMTINPASSISCPDDHLVYFRFLGRIMGRALFDRQLIKGHMVRHLYKHLLGWPITFEDLEAQDEEYYQALKKFTTMEDLSIMCLDFTVTEETMGVRRDVELIEGGNLKEVTSENLSQYLEANLRYRMLNRTKPQLTELLLGFFDVVPEPALTIFDPNELELILCGLPEIDMNDWENNTIYSGLFETKGKRDKVVEWFWDVVRNEFDQEMKARLLQFVTGTSGVPTRGFSVLQGNDGNIKKFAIHGVSRSSYAYPRAHTCFNRIDLPNYTSKKELFERLKGAITLSSVGFDME
jgi:E3 ubiquitin-protein ligase NEDD4